MLSLQTLGLNGTNVGPSSSTMPSGVPIYNAGAAFGAGAAVIPPIVITPWSALAVPAFRRAVELLSSTLASLPRTVTLNGAKLPGPHALDGLLRRRPNECQTAADLWSAWFLHAVHTGNGFLRVDRRGGFWPTALHTLLPEDVCPFRVRHADGVVRQWYAYVPSRRLPGEPVASYLPAADVLHLKGLSHDGMTGVDPVALHAPTFQRASTLDRFQTKFLQQGTVLRGVLKFKKYLTPEQKASAREMVQQFKLSQDGELQDIIILSEDAEFSNVTMNPKDSETNQEAAALTKTFAQITGVPPELLFELSESKYRPTEQEGQNLVRYTLRPWIERAEAEMTDKLLSDQEQVGGYAVNLNPDALLRGDTVAVNKSAADTTNAGLRTKNEGRELLGLPPVDDEGANKLMTLGGTGVPPVEPPAGRQEQAAARPAETFAAGTPEDPHDFSSTQFNLPPQVAERAAAVAAAIPDEQLAEDGRETEFHVTIRYGLHDGTADAAASLLTDHPPVTFTLGKMSVFPASPDRPSDVVKVDVSGPALRALNGMLGELPHTETHAGYTPHLTIAYLKPGEGKRYEGREDLAGTVVTCDTVTFSGRAGFRTEIKLTGEPRSARPAAG
jgi:HK97 family phage portal protein